MDFRTFINEELALGNMGQHVERMFRNKQFDQFAGAFVSGDHEHSQEGYGAPEFAPKLPGTDLSVPQQERTGKITILIAKKNPIFVQLSDGTKAYFTYDEFKRIKGEPALGKTMTIVFQRHGSDASSNNSKIDHAIVTD